MPDSEIPTSEARSTSLTVVNYRINSVEQEYYKLAKCNILLRPLSKLLSFWHIYLAKAYTRPGYIVEEELDTAPILPYIREQLAFLRARRYKPTKVIMGPNTYRRLLKECQDQNLDFLSVHIPTGVALIGGMQLIVSPFLEGIIVS